MSLPIIYCTQAGMQKQLPRVCFASSYLRSGSGLALYLFPLSTDTTFKSYYGEYYVTENGENTVQTVL